MPTLPLNLSDEDHSLLAERAKAAGKTKTGWLRECIRADAAAPASDDPEAELRARLERRAHAMLQDGVDLRTIMQALLED